MWVLAQIEALHLPLYKGLHELMIRGECHNPETSQHGLAGAPNPSSCGEGNAHEDVGLVVAGVVVAERTLFWQVGMRNQGNT